MRGVNKFLGQVKWFGLRKLYWIVKTGILSRTHSQSLIKYAISRKLINDYSGDEGHNLNFTQYFLGFGLIHYAFIRNIKPKNILCVGSRKGFIPAILALACKDNQLGHVDFVDVGYGEESPKKHWSGIGFWKKCDAKKHFAKLGVDRFISTYVMTTKEYALKFPRKKFQYIYIDGDHSYKGVRLDYRLFWPRLDIKGFMVFHDIVAQGLLDKGEFGVWKFWREIANKNAIIFPFPKDSGLGIIQKI